MEEKFIKITNTAYGILDFLPDTDPLKNKAKEKVLAILENLTLISGAEGWISLKKEKASAQLLDDIEVLINYFKVCKSQGWIDVVNFLIITKEYQTIKNSIKIPQGIIRQSLELTETVKKSPLISSTKERLENNQLMAIGESPQKINSVPWQKSSVPDTQLSPKALARQGKILKMLSEKEKGQVSDFIKEMPHITKRTVRRDLDDLLRSGKVVRMGEWNQVFYRIA